MILNRLSLAVIIGAGYPLTEFTPICRCVRAAFYAREHNLKSKWWIAHVIPVLCGNGEVSEEGDIVGATFHGDCVYVLP